MTEEEEEVKFVCTICHHKFCETDDYNRHVLEHDNRSKATSKDIAELENVVYAYILEEMCEMKTQDETQGQLDDHMEVDHGQNHKNQGCDEKDHDAVELTCRACGYEGISNDDIIEHKKKHTLLKCATCDFIAGRNDELEQHQQTEHKSKERIVINVTLLLIQMVI